MPAAPPPRPVAAPVAAKPAAPPPAPVARPAANQESDSGITITAFEPRAAQYAPADMDDQPVAPADAEPPPEAHFIPPLAEAPPPRMPRAEDFPPVARRQMEAHAEHRHHEDRGPLSLLKRLASVGLGRRDDEEPSREEPVRSRPAQAPRPQQPRAVAPQPRAQVPQQPRQVAPQQPPPPPRPSGQEGMYRPRRGDLDAHGRPQPREPRPIDDELEIPAFLRRPANRRHRAW
jgi:cell division protein FtsZ